MFWAGIQMYRSRWTGGENVLGALMIGIERFTVAPEQYQDEQCGDLLALKVFMANY